MGTLTLVVGGQKSGKSSLAARRAATSGRPVTVVTPAVVRDDEFAARVERHRADRPDGWETVESFDLAGAVQGAGDGSFVIVDALDTWLAERMERGAVALDGSEPDRAALEQVSDDVLAELKEFASVVAAGGSDIVLIAGQPGLGVHAGSAGSRAYVDLHGLALQALGDRANEVLLVVAGRVLPLVPDPVSGESGRLASDATVEGNGPLASDAAVKGSGPQVSDVAVEGDGLIDELVRAVEPVDADAAAAARERHAELAKPPGSLGDLEDLGVRLAAIGRQCPPPVPQSPAVIVAAADHGVHAQGVSDWPQDVTRLMVSTVAGGGAAVNAIAKSVGADVTILDVGTAGDSSVEGVLDGRVRAGTRDITSEPAMTLDECAAAITAGARAARDRIAAGADLLATGDLGIGNTTASAALIAALADERASAVAGRGANLDDARVPVKVKAIEAALKRHGDERDPLRTLASLGGLEHAALAGVMLAGAASRVPVVLDGVIADAAALAAVGICPALSGYLIAGHNSAEPGAQVALAALGTRALVDLGMRLGEGTGALLAVPIVQAAARVLNDMAKLADVLPE